MLELRALLAALKWKAADRMTAELMLKAMSIDEWKDVYKEDVLNFPCAPLRTIDNLWLQYSDGKFGFSIQKNIWIDVVGTPENYSYKSYKKFGDRLGWRNSGEWLHYDELTFHSEAPRGHLPWVDGLGLGLLGGFWWQMLAGTLNVSRVS